MASKDDFNKLRDEAFQMLDEDDYAKLKADPDMLAKAEAEMRKTYDELKYMLAHSDTFDDAVRHLPKERQDLIRDTFRLQSFNVDMHRQDDGATYLVCTSLAGTPLSFSFMESSTKLSADNYGQHRFVLVARIVLEIFILFLNLVGISVKINDEILERALPIITKILSANNSVLRVIDGMVNAASRGDNSGVAKSIITCMVDIFKIGKSACLSIVKLLISKMSFSEVSVTVVKFSLFVASLVASGGAALLIRVISLIVGATSFFRKLLQLKELDQLYMSN